MATTNSTKKGLNKYYLDELKTNYASEAVVNTGNQKDSDPVVKNGKYSSGKVKNMTYTLEASDVVEESGRAINYYDYIYNNGNYIYGHPNKWVLDTEQQYQNCGVVSVMNVLSMAGKLNVVAPTKAEKKAMGYTEKTVTDPETGEETKKTVKKSVDFSSTEERLTLYAIKHNFCEHSLDIDKYKSVSDIKFEDGGIPYETVNSETHLYHDSLNGIADFLCDQGVDSHVQTIKMHVQADSSYAIDAVHERTDVETDDNGKQIINYNTYNITTKYFDNEGHLVSTPSGNYSIESVAGSDTIKFTDLTLEELYNQKYALVRMGTTLRIYYNETNYVDILRYFSDGTQDFKFTHIYNVEFGDGTKMSLGSVVAGGHVYSSEAAETPVKQYGSFITELANYIIQGKGVILAGIATDDFQYAEGEGGGHAITLTGVSYKYFDVAPDLDKKEIYDIDGFYVADSGSWVSADGTGVQKITCAQLYNFLSQQTYLKASNVGDLPGRIFEGQIVLTDNCIKDWADDLNITGNTRRNTLLGNDGNNILKGGNSVDNLIGGRGDDTLIGGSGKDWLFGGSGNNFYGGIESKYSNKLESVLIKDVRDSYFKEVERNVLDGGAGDDTYVIEGIERTERYRKDKNGDDIIDENGDREFVGYEKQEVHDIIIPGAGNDTLRFENLTDDSLRRGELEYFNDHGDLVIKYDKYLLDKDTDTYGYCSITVKDYFKKGLYPNIAWLDTKDTIAEKLNEDDNHAYSFLDEIKRNTVQYVINDKIGNKIDGSDFDDEIMAGIHNDSIKGGTGNDIITPNAGDDVIRLGQGEDTVNLTYGNNTVYLESGNNIVKYNEEGNISGYDTIYSGSGKDIIQLKSVNKNALSYRQDRNNLVFYYDEHGSSITLMDFYKKGNSVQFIELNNDEEIDLRKFKENTQGVAQAGAEYLGTVVTSGYGGYGNDTLTASGNTTFEFKSLYDGVDTLKAKSGEITLDFSAIGTLSTNGDIGFNNVSFDRHNYGDKTYAYTKSKNDLIINYGQDIDQESMSRIIIQNYFKANSQKLSYTIKTAGDNLFNLQDAVIYFEGAQDAKNKLTGSKQSDFIVTGELSDVIKSGLGDDIIYAGKGNDSITGGAGNNIINYVYGDGLDTITLTKNENLQIYLKANEDGEEFLPENISYSFDKKGNLLINNNEETILIIKSFNKKDVTGVNGSIQLFVEDALIIDFKDNIFVDKINSFTNKKASYSGKYYSEVIDASSIITPLNKKGKGATIKANGGDDIIIGSGYNDTIKGGVGEDLIIAKSGTNKVDGNEGNDRYFLFYNDKLNDNNEMNLLGNSTVGEDTTINDTGAVQKYDENGKPLKDDKGNLVKDYGNDTAFIFADSEDLDIWFNVGQDGKPINDTDKKGRDLGTITFHVQTTDTTKNFATITGVENLVDKRGLVYNYEAAAASVGAWLTSKGYADVKEAMEKDPLKLAELKEAFKAGWTGEVYEDPEITIEDFTNNSYAGKWYSENINASGLEQPSDGKQKGVSINAGGGSDSITGSKFDDSFVGGSGDDTFIFADNKNGNDTIYDGGNNDIIQFEGEVEGSMSFENVDGKLVISYGDGDKESTVKINNFDFNATKNIGNIGILTDNIDTLKIKSGEDYDEKSILCETNIKVNLKNGQNFTATGYKEVISGFGVIENMSVLDKLETTGQNIFYSRNDLGKLIITAKDNVGEVTDKFQIADFDFGFDDEGNPNQVIRINNTDTSNMQFAYRISNGGTYTASGYMETVTAEGSATIHNLSQGDTLVIEDHVVPTFTRTDENLIISYTKDDYTRTIVLRNFDFNAENVENNFDKLQILNEAGTDYDNYFIKGQTFKYELDGGEYDFKDNKYKTIISGSGKIQNFKRDQVKVLFKTDPAFVRNANSDNLIATYKVVKNVSGEIITEYTMTFVEFFNDSEDEILYTIGDSDTFVSTANMNLTVNLSPESESAEGENNQQTQEETTEQIYTGTRYKETFIGSGTVKALTKVDGIKMDGKITYNRINNGGLIVSNGINTITVSDFFSKTNKNEIRINDTTTENMELNVSLIQESENQSVVYEATKYKENISGKGTVSKLSADDTVIISSETSNISYKRLNLGGLNINDSITINDFFNTDKDQYIKINDGERFKADENSIEIDVTLNDQFTGTYQATDFVERITGTGKVSGLSEQDSLIFEGGTTYQYDKTSGSGLLTINGITIENYNYSDESTISLNILEAGNPVNLSDKSISITGIQTFDASKNTFQFKNLTITGVENVNNTFTGTGFDDTFYGANMNDVIYAGNGNDIINANDGNDTLYGQDGNDAIFGGAGSDTIYGGSGNDTLSGGDGNDIIVGGEGVNTITGEGGDDIYYLFYKNDITDTTQTENENTTISEETTGVNISTGDKAIINANKNDIIIQINADKEGVYKPNDSVLIKVGENNTANMKGIEIIQTKDGYHYNYNSNTLKAAIAAWFTSHADYTDVSDAINRAADDIKAELYAAINTGWEI